jgi:hypothetical protein
MQKYGQKNKNNLEKYLSFFLSQVIFKLFNYFLPMNS